LFGWNEVGYLRLIFYFGGGVEIKIVKRGLGLGTIVDDVGSWEVYLG